MSVAFRRATKGAGTRRRGSRGMETDIDRMTVTLGVLHDPLLGRTRHGVDDGPQCGEWQQATFREPVRSSGQFIRTVHQEPSGQAAISTVCEFVRIRSSRAHASVRMCLPFVNTDRVSLHVPTNFESLRAGARKSVRVRISPRPPGKCSAARRNSSPVR